MQIARLFEIVYLLMDKKTMTAAELAAHFEVSSRTILRDVDALSTAGIPVYTSRGRGGGVFLVDRFVLDKAVLSKQERENILFALRGLASTGQIDTASIARKLKSLFAGQEPGWLDVDFTRWGARREDGAMFERIKSAAIDHYTLTFTYSNARGETAQRTAWPLKVAFKSSAWYMQAYDPVQAAYRTYKISRMKNVTLPGTRFDSAGLEAPPIEPNAQTPPPAMALTLRFSPRAAFRVYDEFDEGSVSRDADGSFLVSASLSFGDRLYDYLLSFGAQVEVLAPPRVRAEMARICADMAHRHADE